MLKLLGFVTRLGIKDLDAQRRVIGFPYGIGDFQHFFVQSESLIQTSYVLIHRSENLHGGTRIGMVETMLGLCFLIQVLGKSYGVIPQAGFAINVCEKVHATNR